MSAPKCRLGTQPKGIGDPSTLGTVSLTMTGCRLGTQPKGIGDGFYPPECFVCFPGVPPRHSAERHWRQRLAGLLLHPLELACRLGTQPKGIGDKNQSPSPSAGAGAGVPPRHSAERHWRRRFVNRAVFAGAQVCRLGTQPKGIGDMAASSLARICSARVPPRHSAERHWRQEEGSCGFEFYGKSAA